MHDELLDAVLVGCGVIAGFLGKIFFEVVVAKKRSLPDEGRDLLSRMVAARFDIDDQARGRCLAVLDGSENGAAEIDVLLSAKCAVLAEAGDDQAVDSKFCRSKNFNRRLVFALEVGGSRRLADGPGRFRIEFAGLRAEFQTLPRQ